MRRKALLIITTLLFFAVVTPLSLQAQTIKGNGKIKTDVRTISGFNKLVVQGQADLYLSQESTENVKIEADENLIELFQTTMVDQTLYIIVPRNIKKVLQLNITVAFKSLEQITLLDEISLKTDKAINFDVVDIVCGGNSRLVCEFMAKEATLNVIDAGYASLRGYVENFVVRANDDGIIEAFDMQSDNCKIISSGYSEVSVNAKKKLMLTVSGQSNIYYMGEPNISQRYFCSTGLITKRKTGVAAATTK